MLVESPVYPNATEALRHAGARLVGSPVDPDGWDLDASRAALRQTAPTLAYLIPDFQNPTGHLMTDAQREEYAAHLRRARTVAVVDEAHQALAARRAGDAATVRGLRPRHDHDRQRQQVLLGRPAARLDPRPARHRWTGSPRRGSPSTSAPRSLEQLVLARLLARRRRDPRRTTAPGCASSATRWSRASRERLPEWRFRLPGRRPRPVVRAARRRSATALVAEAERRGVIVAPGPVFAAEGGLDRFVRIPWTRPVPELEAAVDRLADAWAASAGAAGDDRARRPDRAGDGGLTRRHAPRPRNAARAPPAAADEAPGMAATRVSPSGATSTFITSVAEARSRTVMVVPVFGTSTLYQPGW